MGNEVGKGRYAKMNMNTSHSDSAQVDGCETDNSLSNGTGEPKTITEFADNSEQRSVASEKIAETLSKLNNGYQVLAKKTPANTGESGGNSEVVTSSKTDTS